jgi:hypothetical protein
MGQKTNYWPEENNEHGDKKKIFIGTRNKYSLALASNQCTRTEIGVAETTSCE